MSVYQYTLAQKAKQKSLICIWEALTNTNTHIFNYKFFLLACGVSFDSMNNMQMECLFLQLRLHHMYEFGFRY